MTIGLFLTNSCNFQCRHCLINSTLELHPANEEVINRFYEIVKYNTPETICIVGGEPLLFIDKVEEIVNIIKKYCKKIIIFSNGTFLLDEEKRKRVRKLGVQVRISKTEFHKESWNDKIQDLIDKSPYWKIEGLNREIPIFPRGRALKNKVYQNQKCPCSLVTEDYNTFYHSNRILIMPDGSINIWCPCMALELANIFKDKIISHKLLVEREIKLREFLKEHNLFREDMLFMCNTICNNFKVTCDGIYFRNELLKKFN